MTREQIIDEIANDRMRFVPELRHNTASENAGSSVPFEINRAMCGFAMNFRPTMWTTRALVFGGNQIKLPQLWIGHDFFAQRSTSARDYLDHRLHCAFRFNRCRILLQRLFRAHPIVATSLCDVCARLTEARLQKRTKHDVNIDISFLRMPKSTWQCADDLEPELFPEANGSFVCRNNKVELHRPEAELACLS